MESYKPPHEIIDLCLYKLQSLEEEEKLLQRQMHFITEEIERLRQIIKEEKNKITNSPNNILYQ